MNLVPHCIPYPPRFGFDAATVYFAKYYWGTEKMTRLLRTNKQISREASNVLYGRFNFYLGLYPRKHRLATFLGFLEIIPQAAGNAIKHVTMWKSWSSSNPADLIFNTTVRTRLPCLRSVQIEYYRIGSHGRERPDTVSRARLESLVTNQVDHLRPLQGISRIVIAYSNSYVRHVWENPIDVSNYYNLFLDELQRQGAARVESLVIPMPFNQQRCVSVMRWV